MRINNSAWKLGLTVGASAIALLTFAASAGAQDAQAPQPRVPEAQVNNDKASQPSDDGTVVIVTARRKALRTAIEIKKNSDTIVDSVVADEAGQLPDNSITEVLQRVSGVSISRFDGTNGGSTAFQIEGTGITVRGLPFNSSTLNGQQLFSANGASAISWNEVTPELMAGVDVYKASRADLIEGGASMIDLRTHLPFDFKDTQRSITVGGSYGTQVGKGSPRISAMFSKRFDTKIGEIGVLWDVAYSGLHQQSSDLAVGAMFAEYAPTSTRDDHLAFVPSSFNWSNSISNRKRYGAYQAIQWKPTDNLTLTNTVFYSQYNDDSWSNSGSVGSTPSAASAVMPQNGTPVEYDASGALQKGSLTVGSTGNSVDWTNTTASDSFKAANGSWFPSYYMMDCGGIFGSPASSLQWDWSADSSIDPSNPPADWNGKRLVQCGPAGTFNPSGSAQVSHSKSSTLDISQSFLWQASDRMTVRGGMQYVSSSMTGEQFGAGLPQTSQLVTAMDVDLTGSLPKLSGLSTDGLLDKSAAYLGYMNYHKPNNKGTMVATHFDVEYHVSDDGFLRSVTFGARAANRTEKDDFAGTYWAPLGQSWLADPWAAHPNDPTYGAGNIQYLTNANVPSSDYEVATFKNFFGGKTAVPAQLYVPSQSLLQSYDWYHLLQTYNGQIANGTADQYWTQYIDQGLNKTVSTIDTRAVYIEAKFAHDAIGFIPAFSGNIGVRDFAETLHGDGLLQTPNAASLALTTQDSIDYFNAQQQLKNDPNSSPVFPTLYSFIPGYSMQHRDYSYSRILPSFNIKFDVTNKFIIRAAASRSSAPPNLNDTRAGGSISARSISSNPQAPSVLTGVSANGGGANLKPTMINSQDISFEYYPSSSSYLYLDLFGKQIEDAPVFYSFIANNLPIPVKAYANGDTPPVNAGDPDPGTATTLDLPWLYLQNKSSEQKATIKGFELGGRTFFDQLPGWLRGFGIDGNLTYIDSRNPAQQANSVLTTPPAGGSLPGLNPNGTVPQTYPKLPYAGLSKWAYNIQLLYSYGKVNFRLAYNWRDKALLSTNVNPLSYATSGGNPYVLNTSPTNFDSDHSYPVYNMVPAYTAAAGYLDMGFDYRVNDKVSVSFNANNLLNTTSRTLQEPVPGVFEPYDYNVSDQRYDVTLRAHF